MKHPSHARKKTPRSRRFRFTAGLVVGSIVMLGATAATAATGAFNSGSFSLGCNVAQTGAVTCSGNLPTATTTTTRPPATTTTTTKPPATTTTTAPPATTTTTAPPATTTTTTQPSSGGNCTAPVTTLTAKGDQYDNFPQNTSSSDPWWVQQDEFGSETVTQDMAVCSPSSWTATYPNGVKDDNAATVTYADTEYDVGGRDCSAPVNNVCTTTPLSAYTSITSTLSENFPNNSSNSWDATFDIWTDNWTGETEIWNDSSGGDNGQEYWYNCAEPGAEQNDCVGGGGAASNSQAMMLGGVPYHFLALGSKADCTAAGNHPNCEYIFFRDTQTNSATVNILAAYQWEIANGYANASDVLTQIQYGPELAFTPSGSTFPLTNYTLSLTS